MLCVAKVHLPDWPIDEARDVDPSIEAIRGLLRVHYIVPLRLPDATPPAAASIVTEPETPKRPQRDRKPPTGGMNEPG